MDKKPFHGLVFCPTSIPVSLSDQLCKKVEKLGGTFTKDLTRLVNVLIVGELFTVKYNFAIQNRNDIIFVKPECISQLYDIWLSGGNLLKLSTGDDARNSMESYLKRNYSIAPFELFSVFVGRVADNEHYNLSMLTGLLELGKVKRLDTKHFIRNVDKTKSNANPTVFIADDLSGHRVRAAMEENVPVVHPKWVLDCMERNGTLDFSKYYLTERCSSLDYADIGRGSYMRAKFCPALEADKGDVVVKKEHEADLANPLKVAIEKFKPQANLIWGNLLSKKDSAATMYSGKIDKNDKNHGSCLDSKLNSVFQNRHFIFYRFNPRQQSILSNVVSTNMGTYSVFEDSHSNANLKVGEVYYVCPSDFPMLQLPLVSPSVWVTEYFIERCLYYQQMLEPDYWSKPFYNTFAVSPAKNICHDKTLSFHISGFHGVELLHINKIIGFLKELGLDHHEKLTKKTDFLVVNISQLTSIPNEHPLRQNKYGSMFRSDLDLKISTKQAQMFRNSMKKKIEFVKKHHPIPILTPSFIIELFHRSLTTSESNIYFNDVNWCISCPKGSKSNFALKIIPTNMSKPSIQTLSKNSKSVSRSPTAPPSVSSSSTSERPNMPARIHRWGNLLSNTIETEQEERSFIDDTNEFKDDETPSHTQVTYGSAPQAAKKRKIATRSQIKNIASRV